jgi:hypothetical protein
MQVDRMEPTLNAPESQRPKQKNDKLLTTCAFILNLRRYHEAQKLATELAALGNYYLDAAHHLVLKQEGEAGAGGTRRRVGWGLEGWAGRSEGWEAGRRATSGAPDGAFRHWHGNPAR